MKKTILILSLICLVLLAVLPASAGTGPDGKVVIANRGSGTISVIDARTNALIGTYSLPAGANTPEPMYITHAKKSGLIFVGDRANDRVVAFNDSDFTVAATILAGNGVFHMWSDPHDRQLWVNNDIDNTATVIDPVTLNVLATVPMPADLVAAGYKPHDVILGPQTRYAYVTLLGGAATPTDYVIQYSAETFTELNRAQVGKDPHVSLTNRSEYLYIPAQNSSIVTILTREDLSFVTELAVPGAHGAGMTPNGKTFYASNLTGGGTDGLFAIDTETNTIIGSADTPYPVPHNIAVTKNAKLFLTHSGGTSDKVTIYAVTTADPIPVLIGEVTVGLNPFGLAYVSNS